MIIQRFVLDLVDSGKILKHRIVELNLIGKVHNYNEIVEFLYRETISQIVLIIDSDIAQYPAKLNTLPDFQHLEHFDQLRNPLKLREYKQAIVEFGTYLLFLINDKIGITVDSEFILDAVTEDYIVLSRIEKDPRLSYEGI